MTNTFQNEVLKLSQKIENLANQVQGKLNQGDDPMVVANELVRATLTFAFSLGEMYGFQAAKDKKVKTTVVKGPSNSAAKTYYSQRDPLTGRFVRI